MGPPMFHAGTLSEMTTSRDDGILNHAQATNLALARITRELERLRDEANEAGHSLLAYLIDMAILEAKVQSLSGAQKR